MTGEKDFNLSYESLTSKEARQLLLERISEDSEFYKTLKRSDIGEEEEDQENDGYGGDDGMVCYDEIDSSKTVNVSGRTSAVT